MNRITSFFLLPMVWLLMGCTSVEYQVVEGPMLGTTFHLVAEVEKGLAPTLYEEVMAMDRAMKESMSIFDEESRLRCSTHPTKLSTRNCPDYSGL